MAGVFVTATGTEIGKTHVTAFLTRQGRARGLSVRALKPVLSGFRLEDAGSDSHVLLAAQDIPATADSIAAISPWRFTAPLSPDMAAVREGRSIDFDALIDYCHKAVSTWAGPLLIEGVGGAFVPVTDQKTVADWIKALDLPSIVVAGSYLGTISHTLATVEAMIARGLRVAAVVVSESPVSPVPLTETQMVMQRHLERFGVAVETLPRDGSTDLSHLLR